MAEADIVVKTRWGWACAVCKDGKVTALSLAQPTRAAALAACGRSGGKRTRPAGRGQLRRLAQDLRRYFAGEAVDFSRYPLDLSSLPHFVQRALLAARGIPYGQVRTYGWVAARAGNAKAARAAGQAMSRNPLALLVPCHRVVGAGGRLTGFGGGLPMKRALLALEGMACSRDRVALARPRHLCGAKRRSGEVR
jgi:methylated-DNA-[protein]-cysteine S-methyltransferase